MVCLMANYTIAKVDGETEEETILAIHRVCFPNATPYPVDGVYWWLARDPKGAPAAMAGLTVGTREGGAYLCRSGVLPAHRGQGLQVKLIKRRLALANAFDLNYVVTDTIDNPVSANHLIDCGFRLYHPITPWAHDGSLYWRKELN